jgi:lipopolysaccharide transport system ATP-binding protein
VESLTKTYRLYDSRADRVKETFHPFKRRYHRPFHALHDVSFDIRSGEIFGIVGRNGSGKSTLLEIICGVLEPTAGRVSVDGRVSALLELGAGFNPEFTGRQNVLINGQILGLQPEEIESRMEPIIAFSEIGPFVDQPVKTYSSGMYLRLAFAVAVNVAADILVVDEALAVGDALFQRKCITRIQEIRRRGGTILFVSHDAAAVIEICDRALLLDQGELLAVGAPKPVMSSYHKLLFAPPESVEDIRREVRRAGGRMGNAACRLCENAPPTGAVCLTPGFDPALTPSSTLVYESRGPRIGAARILAPDEKQVNQLQKGCNYRFRYEVTFPRDAYGVRFGMMIKTVTGVELGGSASAPLDTPIACIPGGRTAQVTFQFTCLLKPGVYFFNAGVLGVVDGAEVFLHRIIDVAGFRVLAEPQATMTGWVDFLVESSVLIE